MNKHEELNEFLARLFDNALNGYRATNEYEFLKEKREQLDERMFAAYPADENPLVYDFAFEAGLDAERKTEFIYRQGLKDCVLLLKEFGVLA